MHIKAHPPVFVPPAYRGEIEKLSKATLMDMVWDLATMNVAGDDYEAVMGEVMRVAEIIKLHRRQAKE